MSEYKSEHKKWLEYSELDAQLRAELDCIDSADELREIFSQPLSFGTAGLRGILGVGTNRMNRHTVGQATQGFASVLLTLPPAVYHKGVCICYDCRRRSYEFARLAAEVMAANGIPVRMFSDMRPTPQLSFAIRHFDCAGGINITASHNPPEYNGYKVYWQGGAQISTDRAAQIAKQIERTDIFAGVRRMDFGEARDAGLVHMLDEQMDRLYIDEVLKCGIDTELVENLASELRVVYTPFHGVGGKIMSEVFSRLGYSSVQYVQEQMEPDGSFPTVKSPNPEEPEGFELALKYSQQSEADITIGTDPDVDRIGIFVRDKAGENRFLTGNQTGCLLIDYIINARNKCGKMPRVPAFITTIVTTPLAGEICRQNNVPIFETFTGFKNMAQKESELARKGYSYLLAFEESYGYMLGDHARDKDGIAAAVLILEMACYYKSIGIDLVSALELLYKKYGCYAEQTVSIYMSGVDGSKKMKRLMADLREMPPKHICGVRAVSMIDYSIGEHVWLMSPRAEKIGLSGSGVLAFMLEDGTKYVVRPSGTEPKVKIYVLAKGASQEDALRRADMYAEDIRTVLEG